MSNIKWDKIKNSNEIVYVATTYEKEKIAVIENKSLMKDWVSEQQPNLVYVSKYNNLQDANKFAKGLLKMTPEFSFEHIVREK